jgi:DNA-binding MarR family transcriptional regulator
MPWRALIERRGWINSVLVVLTERGRQKLDAARPIHAECVRKNLSSRLSAEQIDTIVRVSHLLGEEE